jgi:transcriptional regulator with XRE-family HTH domain
MQESLGHRLRVMRAERGLSLREAARRAGMVKETISDIERGHTHPYDVTLAKLAKAYDVPVEELLEEPVAPLVEAPQEQGPPEQPVGEEEIFEGVHGVLVARKRQDEQAQARADESERPQLTDERDVHDTMTELRTRGWNDEAVEAYMKLMWRYVQLEQERDTVLIPSEQVVTFLSDMFSGKSQEERDSEASEAERKK